MMRQRYSRMWTNDRVPCGTNSKASHDVVDRFLSVEIMPRGKSCEHRYLTKKKCSQNNHGEVARVVIGGSQWGELAW